LWWEKIICGGIFCSAYGKWHSIYICSTVVGTYFSHNHARYHNVIFPRKEREVNHPKLKKTKRPRGFSYNYVSIKNAMENPKYTYRTITGVSKEAGVSIDSVARAIKEHPEEIVLLYRKGKNGEFLVTTRGHYKKKASLREKMIGALINRVY
jgi:hypothetical protein